MNQPEDQAPAQPPSPLPSQGIQLPATEQPPPEPPVFEFTWKSGTKQAFRTLSDIQSWLQSELARWSWLDDAITMGKEGEFQLRWANSLKVRLTPLSEASSYIKAFIDKSQSELSAKARQRLLNVQSAEHSGHLFLSHHPQFTYIENLRLTDVVRAMGAALVLFADELPGGPALVKLAATIDAGLFTTNRSQESFAGLDTTLKQYEDKWARTANESRNLLTTLQTELQVRQTELDGLKKAHQEWSEDFVKRFAEWERRSKEDRSNFVTVTQNKYKEDLEAFRQALKANTQLRQPAAMWDRLMLYQWIFAFLALVVTLAMIIGVPILAIHYRTEIAALWTDAKINSFVDYWKLGPAFLATFVYVWLVRIGFRVFLSTRQVATEASLRSNMAQVYAALIAEKSIERNKDTMAQLLEAMFRPVPTELHNAEAPPPTPHTFVQNLMDHQGRKKGE